MQYCFEKIEEAYAARQRFRQEYPDFVVRVEKSPYGGYRIRCYPPDVIDFQLDGGLTPIFGAPLTRKST